MKNILLAMLLLSSLFVAPAYAWPEVDAMNMCNQAVQVTRIYEGGAKGWRDRDSYAVTRKAQLFARNCPQIKAPIKKKVYKKRIHKKKYHRKAKSRKCLKCYRKGFRDGYRAAKLRKSYKKKYKIKRSGYRNHAEEVADCKRVDWANNTSRTKVIAKW